MTEYFSAITPTQRDHCLFSAVGLCPQLLYITSSELLLCSAAPAIGKLITLLHQLLLGDAQRNKTRLTLVSGVAPVLQTGTNPGLKSPANSAQTLRNSNAARRGESVNNLLCFPCLYIDSQHVLYRLEFTTQSANDIHVTRDTGSI